MATVAFELLVALGDSPKGPQPPQWPRSGWRHRSGAGCPSPQQSRETGISADALRASPPARVRARQCVCACRPDSTLRGGLGYAERHRVAAPLELPLLASTCATAVATRASSKCAERVTARRRSGPCDQIARAPETWPSPRESRALDVGDWCLRILGAECATCLPPQWPVRVCACQRHRSGATARGMY